MRLHYRTTRPWAAATRVGGVWREGAGRVVSPRAQMTHSINQSHPVFAESGPLFAKPARSRLCPHGTRPPAVQTVIKLSAGCKNRLRFARDCRSAQSGHDVIPPTRRGHDLSSGFHMASVASSVRFKISTRWVGTFGGLMHLLNTVVRRLCPSPVEFVVSIWPFASVYIVVGVTGRLLNTPRHGHKLTGTDLMKMHQRVSSGTYLRVNGIRIKMRKDVETFSLIQRSDHD